MGWLRVDSIFTCKLWAGLSLVLAQHVTKISGVAVCFYNGKPREMVVDK